MSFLRGNINVNLNNEDNNNISSTFLQVPINSSVAAAEQQGPQPPQQPQQLQQQQLLHLLFASTQQQPQPQQPASIAAPSPPFPSSAPVLPPNIATRWVSSRSHSRPHTPHDPIPAAPAPSQELRNLPDLRARTRGYVQEAIQLIPQAEKEAYVEACTKVPELVRKESDPLKFIRYCEYDAWSAAHRLCLYWKERKSLFGERAFLPLVLTGTGALVKQDILQVQAGWPALLPDSTKGQKTVLADRRKWIPTSNTLNKLRASFFVFHELAKDDRAQTEPDWVQMLIVHVAPRVVSAESDFLDRASHLLAHVYPVKVQIHMAIIPSPRQPYVVQNIISRGLQFLAERQTHVDVHIEREKGELLDILQQEMNLTLDGIPMDLGGNWRIDMWFRWCQQRIDTEREQYQWLQWEYPNSESQKTQNGPPKHTHEDKLERRRLADLLHSRRKRERKKQHLSSLKEESTRLVQENAILQAEQARLEALLEKAQKLVS